MTMQRTTRTALLAVIGVCCSTGLAWASVPLYRMFCQATGLNGTTGRALRAPGAVDGKVTVAFDTNVAPGFKWNFKPENESETIDIGARDMAFFDATNTSGQTLTGTATFNVTPAQAGIYFKKIQCFCFTQQTLKPGETQRMPVIFFVDPAILKDPDARDIQTITLSYTFYPVDSAKTPS
ncbi:MAG: cytochrome c oxidase assembly protein [Sphingomonadales bacterium]|jgi:cytochrome c oxidase assembly protein subunit 11|nr:cytochrome c oxidase assembly protein [Sphingomonadales bacterium]